MNTATSTSTLHDLVTAARAVPPSASTAGAGLSQSLGQGAAGIALLHLEHDTGTLTAPVQAWLSATLAHPIASTSDAGLFTGAPAVAFTLARVTRPVGTEVPALLATLLTYVARAAHARLDVAEDRIRRDEPVPDFAEYDLISGLTGIGALYLSCAPGNDVLERILDYLATLTRLLPSTTATDRDGGPASTPTRRSPHPAGTPTTASPTASPDHWPSSPSPTAQGSPTTTTPRRLTASPPTWPASAAIHRTEPGGRSGRPRQASFRTTRRDRHGATAHPASPAPSNSPPSPPATRPCGAKPKRPSPTASPIPPTPAG